MFNKNALIIWALLRISLSKNKLEICFRDGVRKRKKGSCIVSPVYKNLMICIHHIHPEEGHFLRFSSYFVQTHITMKICHSIYFEKGCYVYEKVATIISQVSYIPLIIPDSVNHKLTYMGPMIVVTTVETEFMCHLPPHHICLFEKLHVGKFWKMNFLKKQT